MEDGWAPYVAAVAAVIAAVLTLVNLVVAGRREERAWSRAALEDAFVGFLNGCYDERGAAKEIALIRAGMWSRRTEAEWTAKASESHDSILNNLTLIRVLAGDDTAELAREVKERADVVLQMLLDSDLERYNERADEERDSFILVRDRFTAEARRILNLPAHRRGRWERFRRRAASWGDSAEAAKSARPLRRRGPQRGPAATGPSSDSSPPESP